MLVPLNLWLGLLCQKPNLALWLPKVMDEIVKDVASSLVVMICAMDYCRETFMHCRSCWLTCGHLKMRRVGSSLSEFGCKIPTDTRRPIGL